MGEQNILPVKDFGQRIDGYRHVNFIHQAGARLVLTAHDNSLRSALEDSRANADELEVCKRELTAALQAQTERCRELEGVLSDHGPDGHNVTNAQLVAVRDQRDAAITQLAQAHCDLCENGHATHEECTEACSCVGSGKSRIEIAEARAEELEGALGALGVIGHGYCFCSKDRDPDKVSHEPECRDARAALRGEA